jgi:hypothetical protein
MAAQAGEVGGRDAVCTCARVCGCFCLGWLAVLHASSTHDAGKGFVYIKNFLPRCPGGVTIAIVHMV